MKHLLIALLCGCGVSLAADVFAANEQSEKQTPAAKDQYRIDRAHPVVDPVYGEILYDYYQKRYFSAMTRILIAQETGGLPTQGERAEVLLGALYASYGMPREAEALFDKLLSKSVDPVLATRIWIHLSNLYYQQQRYQKALDTLDKHVTEVPKDLRQNYYALRTRILMKLGRYDDTSIALDGLENAVTLSGYLKYNLAVSRINVGQGDAGEAFLWDLVNLVPGDEEINSLKDKSILALGVHFLRSGNPRRAQSVLGAARLEGPSSETGLLLHARAWLATQEPRKAMGSLQALSRRSMQFEEAQEAAISLPFLYEQLGDFGRAQQGYRDAIAAYTEHYKYLAALEEKIRSGLWFQELAKEPTWSTAMDPLPPFEPKRVESFATFQHLFATHKFNTRWLDFHEQWRQIRLLDQWQQRLPAMDELLAAHIRKHRAQTPQALALLRRVESAKLPAQFHAMQSAFDKAVQGNNYHEFATEDQLVMLQQLSDARDSAARLRDKLSPEKREKLEFYNRVLRWEIEKDIVPLRWQRQSELHQLEKQLNAMQEYYQRVDWAARGDLNRITTLGHQLAGMHNALSALQGRGYELLARQQNGIEELALEQVAYTRKRLLAFTAECWGALGDIQHRAYRASIRPPLKSSSWNEPSNSEDDVTNEDVQSGSSDQ